MKVFIRPLERSDAMTSYLWRNDPDIWAFTGNRPDRVITPEDETKWIDEVLQRQDQKRFAICIKETAQYIGNVQLTGINQYQAEFHIFIGEKQYWSGGFGTEATLLMVRYAFEELGLKCVFLQVKRQNKAAVRAYEKVGFYKIVDVDVESIKMVIYAMETEKKTVSVFMMAFNHAKFIEQAIRSVLSQKVKFKFEIVIGEDKSTDETREIILRLAAENPETIKLLLHEKNIGACKNQAAILHACKGEYVAFLEGDDFWNDQCKLQKQVNFLEDNKEFAFCFHRTYVLYKNGKKKISPLNPEQTECVFTIEDIASRSFIHTPTVIYRNGLFGVDEIPLDAPVGDYIIHLLNARKGKIKYFPDIMATYRVHDNGAWSSLGEIEMSRRWLWVLAMLMGYDFTPEVKGILKQQFIRRQEYFFVKLLLNGRYDEFSAELKTYMDSHPEEKDIWLFERIPAIFQSILESRTYKMGRKIGVLANVLHIK